jgi:hypothetical protein
VRGHCTDGTAARAEAAGAYVFETVDNSHRKAGALNQVLDILLPELTDEDAVLVMDADSVLAPTFVAEAKRHLRDGVGGVFTGRSGGGFVGMLQRNEYARYARDVARLKGRVLVLTGTATLFSAKTLRHVVGARVEGQLPRSPAAPRSTSSRRVTARSRSCSTCATSAPSAAASPSPTPRARDRATRIDRLLPRGQTRRRVEAA